jgi:hypothetical protein
MYVPGWVGAVNEAPPPASMFTSNRLPLVSAVTVCATRSRFITMIVDPAATVAGTWYAKSFTVNTTDATDATDEGAPPAGAVLVGVPAAAEPCEDATGAVDPGDCPPGPDEPHPATTTASTSPPTTAETRRAVSILILRLRSPTHQRLALPHESTPPTTTATAPATSLKPHRPGTTGHRHHPLPLVANTDSPKQPHAQPRPTQRGISPVALRVHCLNRGCTPYDPPAIS